MDMARDLGTRCGSRTTKAGDLQGSCPKSPPPRECGGDCFYLNGFLPPRAPFSYHSVVDPVTVV